jgi:hypothetical protein
VVGFLHGSRASRWRDRLSVLMHTFVDYLIAVKCDGIDLSARYGLKFVQLHPDSISHTD